LYSHARQGVLCERISCTRDLRIYNSLCVWNSLSGLPLSSLPSLTLHPLDLHATISNRVYLSIWRLDIHGKNHCRNFYHH
jgi:hypothetical protein